MSREIHLTQGYVAIIDDDDFALISRWKWQAAKRGKQIYATTDVGESRSDKRKLYMHRVILDAPENLTVDHINGNGLDNRRENLRLATRQQNVVNRHRTRQNPHSQYRGVFLASNKRTWFAQIVSGGKSIYLGTFPTQFEAAQAYNEASVRHHGEYGYTNDLSGGPLPDDVPFPR